jgi:hypothetical protein
MLRVKLSQKSLPESSSERVDKAISYIAKHLTISARKTVTIFKVNSSFISKRLTGKIKLRALIVENKLY